MGCYVIVTCHSMLWTLLTVTTTLGALYCVTSTSWLIGYERTHDGYNTVTRNTVMNNTGGDNTYYLVDAENSYDQQRIDRIPTYQPSIGLYSRCVRVQSGGRSVLSCASFASSIGQRNDLFPIAWQASLVLVGISALLLLFTMICSILSLCVRDFCRKSIFTISGLIQVVSGLFMSVAVAIYPIGWSSAKVRYFCGMNADVFNKDECSIGWAYIVLIACTASLFFTGMLSIKADKATSKDKIEDEILQGKHLICVT